MANTKLVLKQYSLHDLELLTTEVLLIASNYIHNSMYLIGCYDASLITNDIQQRSVT